MVKTKINQFVNFIILKNSLYFLSMKTHFKLISLT